ncbi:MAG: Ig-like domain-containing protein, partial [Gammaproteobacteria bacterium]
MIPTTRQSVTALLAVVALTTTACENGLFQEPSAESASLVLDLEAPSVVGGPSNAFDAADRVRVQALNGQRVRFDRTIPIQAEGRNLQLTIDIPRRRLRETLTLQVEVRRGDAPLFRGSVPLQIRLGRRPSASLSLDAIGHALLLPASHPLITAYGDSVRADGTVVFATGDTLAVGPVLWTSLDPSVVAITGGVPVTRADGDARLVGRTGTLQDTLTVRVLASVQTLVLQPDAGPLSIGGTRQFSTLLFDRRGNPIVTQRPITWSTTEPSIVMVTQAGLATGVGIGTSRITAASGAGSASLMLQSQPGAPVVATDSVNQITPSSAEFHETVRPNGAPTEAWFEYARDTTFTNSLSTPV